LFCSRRSAAAAAASVFPPSITYDLRAGGLYRSDEIGRLKENKKKKKTPNKKKFI